MKVAVALGVFALTAAGFAASAEAVCRKGETKFRNNVQYTCVCYTSGGNSTCTWVAD